ncbi:MAG TPA: sugar transferase [Bacteroidales bacterium]|nr:sugar transferase [Bacteroidales bacterium]
MLKRVFDIIFSLFGLIILLPFLLIIFLLVLIESKGGVFYRQIRVGKNNDDFKLFKIRTMFKDADKKGLLTIGERDNRITRIGYFLRKYKIDEFPQLMNILAGDMSFVGPRPEVRKYVDLYNEEQRRVLSVKPGLTDFASLKYYNENEYLSRFDDPEKEYIQTVMPDKIKLNLEYIRKQNFWLDIKILLQTLFKWVN